MQNESFTRLGSIQSRILCSVFPSPFEFLQRKFAILASQVPQYLAGCHRGFVLPLRLLKLLSKSFDLFLAQCLTCFCEHLAFFFFDMMLNVFLEDRKLCSPLLGVFWFGFELSE